MDILSGTGELWFTCTEEIKRHKVEFIKRNRAYIDDLLEIFVDLMGYVDIRHTQAHKWIRCLGFSVGPETALVGPRKMPFYKFQKRRG